MANKMRSIVAGEFYHVYNRAVDKRVIFYTEKDYEYFLSKVLFFKEKTGIKIIAYCVLPNHWHFLLKEPETKTETTFQIKISSVSKFISLLTNSYTKYFNLNKDHSGLIFQGPFKSKLVSDDNYLRVLINYINLNPLKHKISKKAGEWPYTSDHNYVGETKCNLIDYDYLVDFKDYKKGISSYLDYMKSIDEEF